MARDAVSFVEPFLVTDGDKFNLKSHDPGRTRIARRRGPHGGGRNELVGAVVVPGPTPTVAKSLSVPGA
jgi:hypothetical protein